MLGILANATQASHILRCHFSFLRIRKFLPYSLLWQPLGPTRSVFSHVIILNFLHRSTWREKVEFDSLFFPHSLTWNKTNLCHYVSLRRNSPGQECWDLRAKTIFKCRWNSQCYSHHAVWIDVSLITVILVQIPMQLLKVCLYFSLFTLGLIFFKLSCCR